MSVERWGARLVLLVGMSVLIATSDDSGWEDSKMVEASLESQGAGDDKLVRINVQLSGRLSRRLDRVVVGLSGLANRPISDVRVIWPSSESDAGMQDAGSLGGALDGAIVMTPTVHDGGADDASVTGAGPYDAGASPTQYSAGFLKLSSYLELEPPDCEPKVPCELTIEARVAADVPTPYTLALEASVALRGEEDADKPSGKFDVSVEVRDAP